MTVGEKLPPKKRGRKPKLDPELVAAALAELQGNVAAVAKRFGVDRSAVRQLIDKRPALARVCRDAREGMLDHGESALYRAVIAGEAWAVCFFLKTQGKTRGYVEKHQVEQQGGGGADISVELVARAAAVLAARPVPGGPSVVPEAGGASPGVAE